MTEDERAEAVLAMLENIKYCSKCKTAVQADRIGGFPPMLDPPRGPFLCPDCWWEQDTEADVSRFLEIDDDD